MRQLVVRVCRSGFNRLALSGLVVGHSKAAASLLAHSRAYPFATNLSLIAVPIGILALVIGPDVSRAFTDVFARPEPIYVWGVILLLGGLNVAYGIVKHIPSRERGGLYVLAFAYAFYGISVIYGLGVGGLVTGPISLVLAISAVQRARVFDSARIIALAQERTSLPVSTDAHTGLIVPATVTDLIEVGLPPTPADPGTSQMVVDQPDDEPRDDRP